MLLLEVSMNKHKCCKVKGLNEISIETNKSDEVRRNNEVMMLSVHGVHHLT